MIFFMAHESLLLDIQQRQRQQLRASMMTEEDEELSLFLEMRGEIIDPNATFSNEEGDVSEGGEFLEPLEEAKLFIENLAYDADSQALAMLFEKVGTVGASLFKRYIQYIGKPTRVVGLDL
ncbi:hypothetical protein IGI04_018885 [Brassica rapa subsp. trilocularis]|uniref:RRM domain-containing protein n=1 Tax=Brassica rapa subsp. trilocularis TaxID=1813537 RepID=A0ABQ7MHQ1_BRACM|nr:hypothetical protein IGI04_018885 [Brassica rapa subsp. trilocularis]